MKTPRSLAFVMLAVIPLVAVPAAQAAPAAEGPAQEPAVVVAPAEVTPEGARYADTILRRLNELRAQQGLAPVTRYTQLDSVAQGWSEQMAAQRSMTHNAAFADQYPGGWTSASENVAVLGDFDATDIGDQMFAQWLSSPGHYANMVAPAINAVGIGVAYDSETGSWYATQNFATYPDPAAVGLTPTTGAASPSPAAPAQPGGESAAPAPTAANDGAAEPSAAADPASEEPAPQTDPAADPASEEAAPAEPEAEKAEDATAESTPAGDRDPVVAAAATAPAASKPALLTLPVTGASLIGGVVALIAIVAGLVLLRLRRRR